MAEPQSARGWLSALALLGLALVLPPAVAVGLRGDEGVPRSLPVDSADATSAADAALRELNVRVHHYCGGQGTFDSISLRSAAVAVISDAAELELSATLDGAYPALLGLARGPSGKWTLVRSEPYACEIRSEGGAMAINSRAAIEKHNADPARTHERAAYKFLGGRTDSQILERLLPASSRAGVRPPGLFGATQLEAPAGVAQRFAIELEPAVAHALEKAMVEKGRSRSRGKPSSSPSSSPGKSGGEVSLPDAYDVRTALGGACDPSRSTKDQGSCASCWAQSNAGMFEDRLCLATAGAVRVQLSTQQHVSCDRLCWPPPNNRYCNAGCDGGFQMLAGEYLETVGLVESAALLYSSGVTGSYEDHFTARHESATCPASLGQHRHYRAARDSTQTIRRGDIRSMQNALLNGGSLDTAMMVYQDFFTYRSGIYKWPGNTPQAGGHAVKIVGYGTEKGVDFWACQNSWGSEWGEKGFFRIQRGTNEAAIESSVVTTRPDLGGSFASLSSTLVGRGQSSVSVGHHVGAALAAAEAAASSWGGDTQAIELGQLIAFLPPNSKTNASRTDNFKSEKSGAPAKSGGAAKSAGGFGVISNGAGHGTIEVTSLRDLLQPPLLRVEVDGANGLTTLDTSSLPPGSYGVRYCPDQGACEPLDEKLTVSACPVRNGLVCGGRGSCDEAAGSCKCDPGFGGVVCARVCGVLPALKCNCAHHGGLWDGMPSVLQRMGRGADSLLSLTVSKAVTVTLSTCNGQTDADTVLAVYKGCPLAGNQDTRSRSKTQSGEEPLPIVKADDWGCGLANNATAASVGLPAGASHGAGYGLLAGSQFTIKLAPGAYTVVVSGFDEHSIGAFLLTVDCSDPSASLPPGPSRTLAGPPRTPPGPAGSLPLSPDSEVDACKPTSSGGTDEVEGGDGDYGLAEGNVNANANSLRHASSPPPLPTACRDAPLLRLGESLSGDLSQPSLAGGEEGGGGTPGTALYCLVADAKMQDKGPAMVVASTCGSEADTEVALFRGCPLAGGQLLGRSDDECGLGGFVEAAVTLPVTPAVTPPSAVSSSNLGNGGKSAQFSKSDSSASLAHSYYVRVSGHKGVRGAYTVSAHAESVSCAHASLLKLAKLPPAAKPPAAMLPAGGNTPSAGGGGADSGWSGSVSLCASGKAAGGSSPFLSGWADGPDYGAGVPHAALTFSLSERTLLSLDACTAPAGTRLELFAGCAGAPGEVPLGAADSSDGDCLQVAEERASAAALSSGLSAQAAGRSAGLAGLRAAAAAQKGEGASGARISTTLRPGLYSLVLSGARASPEQVCRPFQLVAAASPAPLRKWTTAEAGCTAHSECAAQAKAVAEGGAHGTNGTPPSPLPSPLLQGESSPLFCADSRCEPCERCEFCAMGVDNTCGPFCDARLFPTKERPPLESGGCVSSELVAYEKDVFKSGAVSGSGSPGLGVGAKFFGGRARDGQALFLGVSVMLVAVAALTVAGRSFALSSQMQRPTSVLSLGTLGAPPPRPSDALEGGTPLRTPRHSDDGLPPRPLRASDGSSPPHPPRTSDGGAVLL